MRKNLRYATTVRNTPSEARRKWCSLGLCGYCMPAAGASWAARYARRPSVNAAGRLGGFARRGWARGNSRGRGAGFASHVRASLRFGSLPRLADASRQRAPTLRSARTLLRSARPAPTACPRCPAPPHAPPPSRPAARKRRGGERSDPPSPRPPPSHLSWRVHICNLRSCHLYCHFHLCNVRSCHLYCCGFTFVITCLHMSYICITFVKHNHITARG